MKKAKKMNPKKTVKIMKSVREPQFERMNEIHRILGQHYGNICLLYAVASGEKKLKKIYKLAKPTEDTKRLLWTVTNLQTQIAPLENELYQLIKSSKPLVNESNL